MAEDRPILVLQMQRMGDLILTFPLLLWLSVRHPGRPIWVVGEETFLTQLTPLSPPATYFPWSPELGARLRGQRFALIINLSHRPEAAELAASLEAEDKLGPLRQGGATYVRGDWQLYRASLTLANRHNRFHWAELNALDAIPAADLAGTAWPAPRALDPDNNRVGLFLGASEDAKRPGVWFWASLCQELLRRDLRPVLLGGPKEKFFASEVAAFLKRPVLNLAGRQTLSQLAAAGKAMQLLVTPDTGPMHLAAWTGLKTLCLSMGPINSWETGPYQPGHYVLRSKASCVGCWTCNRREIVCRQNYKPKRIAMLIRQMVRGKDLGLDKLDVPSLDLYRTGRADDGLYALKRASADWGRTVRSMLSHFWRQFFGARFGLWPEAAARAAFGVLAEGSPRMAETLAHDAVRLAMDLKKTLRGRGPLGPDFWSQGPPLIRPARSFCQVFLQNADYAPAAKADMLRMVELLAGLGR